MNKIFLIKYIKIVVRHEAFAKNNQGRKLSFCPQANCFKVLSDLL